MQQVPDFVPFITIFLVPVPTETVLSTVAPSSHFFTDDTTLEQRLTPCAHWILCVLLWTLFLYGEITMSVCYVPRRGALRPPRARDPNPSSALPQLTRYEWVAREEGTCPAAVLRCRLHGPRAHTRMHTASWIDGPLSQQQHQIVVVVDSHSW